MKRAPFPLPPSCLWKPSRNTTSSMQQTMVWERLERHSVPFLSSVICSKEQRISSFIRPILQPVLQPIRPMSASVRSVRSVHSVLTPRPPRPSRSPRSSFPSPVFNGPHPCVHPLGNSSDSSNCYFSKRFSKRRWNQLNYDNVGNVCYRSYFTSTPLCVGKTQTAASKHPATSATSASFSASTTSPPTTTTSTTTPTTTTTATETNETNEHDETLTFLTQTLSHPLPISSGIISALLQSGIPPSSLLPMVKSLAGRYEVGEDAGLEALANSVKMDLERRGERKEVVRVWCLPPGGWSPAVEDVEEESVDASNSSNASDAIGNNATNSSSKFPTIHSLERAFPIEAMEGSTLTDVAKFGTCDNAHVLGEYIECACSGIMACSTCHVVIHPDWYDSEGDGAGGLDEGGESDENGGGDGDENGVSCNGDDIENDGGTSTESKMSEKRKSGKIGPPSEAEQDMIDLAYEPQVTSRLGCQIVLTKELDGLVILLPRGSNNLMDFVPFE